MRRRLGGRLGGLGERLGFRVGRGGGGEEMGVGEVVIDRFIEDIQRQMGNRTVFMGRLQHRNATPQRQISSTS